MGPRNEIEITVRIPAATEANTIRILKVVGVDKNEVCYDLEVLKATQIFDLKRRQG